MSGHEVNDELPPFLLGYNRYYFERDVTGARRALYDAAWRNDENRAALEKFAVMIRAEAIPDPKAARDYLQRQHDASRVARLRQMLARRIVRMDGLIALQEAQTRYEKRFGRLLDDPADLLRAGVMRDFPVDPLGIGYVFADGGFRLKEVTVGAQDSSRQ